MSDQSWMPGDVYFGKANASPANWRQEESTSDTNDDEPPSEEERAAIVKMLGFDPKEIEDEE